MPKLQVNKYTGRPFSARFWQILEKRKTLPVWEYYTNFMETVKKHRSVVLVGETGSGKTTQVRVVFVHLHIHVCECDLRVEYCCVIVSLHVYTSLFPPFSLADLHLSLSLSLSFSHRSPSG